MAFDYYKYAGPLGLGSGCAYIVELFIPGRLAAVAADHRATVRGQ